MTITQETNNDVPLHDPATGPAAPDHDSTGAETPQDDRKPPREQRYRIERNEAREALSTAETRIADLQVRELERLAGEHLAQPGDLLGIGQHSLANFLTPEGWIDHDAVADAAADLIDSRPGLAKNPRIAAVDRSQGRSSPESGQPQWADLFKE